MLLTKNQLERLRINNPKQMEIDTACRTMEKAKQLLRDIQEYYPSHHFELKHRMRVDINFLHDYIYIAKYTPTKNKK